MILYAVLILGLFATAILVTLARWHWIPLQSRGPGALLFNFVGGSIWVLTALCQVCPITPHR